MASGPGFPAPPWPGAETEAPVSEGRRRLALGLGAVLLICIAALRRWIGGGVCRSGRRLDGKTVLVTGANAGIGKETCRELARRGARVVMACRDLSRAERAAEDIRGSTGNGNVVIRHLDLASLYSVRQFAKDFAASEDRLDVLVNNAGVMMCPKWLTEDGFETQFAVNHLSHFLLTNLLLPKLKSSAPSRVVTVSSLAHRGGHIDFSDLFFSSRPYSPLQSYRQSKLANVLFSRELARRLRGEGVSSFCVHPGVIRTELGRHVEGRFPLLGTLLRLPAALLMKTPRQGCQTTLYCAVTPGLEELSGSYFSERLLDRGAGRNRGSEGSRPRKRPSGAFSAHSGLPDELALQLEFFFHPNEWKGRQTARGQDRPFP